MYNIIVNSVCMLYRKLIKRVSPKSSHHHKEIVFLFLKKKSYLQPDIHNIIYNNQHIKTICLLVNDQKKKL